MRFMLRLAHYFQKVTSATFLLAALLQSTALFGQEPQEPDACHDVLRQTQVKASDSVNKKLDYLRLIETEEDWKQARGVSGGLGAIFDSIPAKATANYNDFVTWQQSTFKETNFNLADAEAHSLETSFLSNRAIDAWKDCMKIKAGGLALAIDGVTANTATIHLYWVKPSSVPGTSETPVTIAPESTTGGSPPVAWPRSLRKVTTDIDEVLSYSRTANLELDVYIRVSDNNGHHATAHARVPAEPQYRQGPCTFNLSDGFHGVPHGTTWDFPPCTGLQPGKQVAVALKNASFQVDRPHACWIILADEIDSDSVVRDTSQLLYIPLYPGDPPAKANDDNPKSWNFSHVITVPWDGVVDVSIDVVRAQAWPGSYSTLSASGGTLEIK